MSQVEKRWYAEVLGESQVEKRWYALRILASIQALLAWIIAIGALGYGIAVAGTLLGHARRNEEQFVEILFHRGQSRGHRSSVGTEHGECPDDPTFHFD